MRKLVARIRASLRGASRAVNESPLEEAVDPYLAGQWISSAIVEQRPFLASRLGFTESYCLTQATHGRADRALYERIWRESGVFPPEEGAFQTFSQEYLGALREVDLLGIMKDPYTAFIYRKFGNDSLTCRLSALEPYRWPHPWSQHLAGKKVCVIHPFARSIADQYSKHGGKLFLDRRVLPSFDLRVVRAPQTATGNTDGHASWSQALRALEQEVMSEDFDVAIAGCGAYGLPVGAFIKRHGKVCVHIGGATQMLFGVVGRRWRNMPAFRTIINDKWRAPLENERPANFHKLEDGCYW
jgi:hypothetical protein